ncbi:MAG: hypothetical protein ACKO4S_01095 [Snowella sp.]
MIKVNRINIIVFCFLTSRHEPNKPLEKSSALNSLISRDLEAILGLKVKDAIAFVSSQVKQLWTTQNISRTAIIPIVPKKITVI